MILSIESSCDDSSIALTRIKTKELVFHKKISQEIDHSVYGGVVPELAARLHAIALPKILEEVRPYFHELKAVAVTNEPGLSVTLVEGVAMAKALSISLNIPLLAINHLKGHIYSLFIEKETTFPMGVLLVSGGHTQVLHVKDHDTIESLASTLDDSFGESFDKVAKMLDLGYPGGPIVEQYATQGDASKHAFTVPLWQSPKIAFSYSGLKNQVRLAIEALGENITEQDKYDLCAAFQETASKHLLQKLTKLFKTMRFERFAVVGGASANLYLRAHLEALVRKYGMELEVAELKFCSDNAAMIGRCAVEAYTRQEFVSIDDIKVNPKALF